MSDVVSFTEIHGQYVELLPGRTLLQTRASAEDGATYISGSTIDHDTIDLDGNGIDDRSEGGAGGGRS